jgi:phosphoribosyl 1,2-cyclic phosphodiesterase
VPAPLSPSQVRSKIAAALERLRPSDLESATSRERFLAGLPDSLFGTVGGNTPCVEVASADGERLVFDAGSGIRNLGLAAVKEIPRPTRYRLFFSHFHWDHLQGLPFFGPAYDPSVHLDFYSPREALEETLRQQMRDPFFPVAFDATSSKKTFTHMTAPVHIGKTLVSFKKLNHPGSSYSFSVTEGTKRFIYATDTELTSEDFVRNDENASFFGGADVLVIDSQYTLGEAIEKYNWGHSAFSLALDFASTWGIQRIYLFHHDPAYDDKKVFGILQSARWYLDHLSIKGIEVHLAMEGLEIRL